MKHTSAKICGAVIAVYAVVFPFAALAATYSVGGTYSEQLSSSGTTYGDYCMFDTADGTYTNGYHFANVQNGSVSDWTNSWLSSGQTKLWYIGEASNYTGCSGHDLTWALGGGLLNSGCVSATYAAIPNQPWTVHTLSDCTGGGGGGSSTTTEASSTIATTELYFTAMSSMVLAGVVALILIGVPITALAWVRTELL